MIGNITIIVTVSRQDRNFIYRMATISLSSRFRLTLLQISDILGRKETNIHDVLSLCTYISPEKSEQINNAEDLFDVLQDLNLLNERKVDELIDLLDKLKLPQVSELLKNYKKSNLNGMKFSEFFFCSYFNLLVRCQ